MNNKLEKLFNRIIYDADTMPEISLDIDDGIIFEGATNEELKAFKKANYLPQDMEQGNVETWMDKIAKNENNLPLRKQAHR